MPLSATALQDLAFTFEATPQATGFFEVEVNSVLVHTKKGGQVSLRV